MSLRNPSNPQEMRRLLHTVYEPYAQGIVSFPRARVTGDLESVPKRTQPIAKALIDAWAEIDDGREIHQALVRHVLKDPRAALTDAEGKTGRGMVVSKIGRNSLTEVIFTPVFERGIVVLETNAIGPRSAVDEYLAQHSVTLSDGRTITAGGFDEGQNPDIMFPVQVGNNLVGDIVHYDARLSQAI
jgi:hypothetical protein